MEHDPTGRKHSDPGAKLDAGRLADLLVVEEAARIVVAHANALSSPRAHRLGCDCGGMVDGYSCRGLTSALAALSAALEEEDRT